MKVLLVEDNRGDARLIQEMLRRGGAQFELTHVIRLSKALQRLGEETFDVILLDLGLPDSQGIDTFDKIHAQAPDAPVVVLSGTDNEALAIETVQHGAQDYLVKGQVDRNPLVRAIRYAVERKRMEKRLANEDRLLDFLDSANDLIQSVAPDGHLLLVNRAWRETLGYTEEEAAKLSIFDVVHPDSLEHCMGVFQRVMSGEEVNRVEAEFVAKDGRTVAVEGNVNCRFEGGKPVATRGIFRDVTEHKRIEDALKESAKEYRGIISTTIDGFWQADMQGRFLDVNEAYSCLTGYSREELLNMSITDIEATEKPEETTKRIRKLKRTGSDRFETQHRCKNGVIIDVDISVNYEPSGGGRMFVFVRDVTAQKRAEEALKESEEALRTTFETIGDGITITDMEGRIVSVNDAMCGIVGWRREELIGRQGFDFIAEQDRDKALEKMMQVFDKGSSIVTEYKLLQKDGREHPVEASATLLRNASGNAVGLVSVVRDVTERKQTEEALRSSEGKLRAMFDAITDGIITIDMEGRVLELNEAAFRIPGYSSREELLGANAFHFIAEKDRERAANDVMKSISEGTTVSNVEYAVMKKDGSTFDCEMSTAMLKDASDNPVGFIAVERDISERKRAEAALREYKTAVEQSADGIALADMEGHIRFANEAWAKMHGYSADELVGQHLSVFHTQEQMEKEVIPFNERLITEGSRRAEIGHARKDGATFPTQMITTLVRREDGDPFGLLAICSDITERKRMEEALRASEEELRTTFASVSDAIIVTDEQGTIKEANDASYQISGYSRRELIGRNSLELIRREDHETLVNLMLKNIEEKSGLSNFVVGFIKKDGSEIEAEFSSTPMLNADGELTGFTTVARDITERKRMEEALRASEEKLRFMFESTSDGIVVTDLKGVIVNANEALTRIAGFDRKEELIGRDGFGLLVEGDGLKASKDTARANEYGRGGTREYTLLRNGGGMLNVEVSADLLKDAPGESVGIICVVRDVTERKQAEETIRRRNRELQAINAIARLLSRPMRMDKMLQAALSSALDIVDISSGGIWLVGEAGGVLTPAVYQGVSPKLKKSSAVIEMGEGVTGQAAMTGEVVIAPDFLRNSEPAHSHQSAARMQGLQSIIGVPIKAKGKTLGVMTLFEHGCRHFSPGDIQLLETIGGEIGVAIENAQLLEKLNELSVTDELTGLYNRRHFYEVLDNEAARTQRYGHPFSLVIIDLDGFKQYNDTFGHVSGDVALEDFANAINLTLRKTDVAFRHGGDEFAVILPSTDACKARKVIKRLRARWEQVSVVRYKSLKTPLGFSAGIAQLPGDAETADGLLAVADIAMYHAKESGKYRTELASGL